VPTIIININTLATIDVHMLIKLAITAAEITSILKSLKTVLICWQLSSS
jgi:hypothetical protein